MFKKNLLASLLLSSFVAQPALADTTLNIYNWSEYLPTELLTQFTKETDIKVNYSTFESNETMYTKIKMINGKGYDLVFPSTYYVSKMADEGLLAKLDHSKITAFSKLDSTILNQPFDPNNQYSIPYVWGSTALGYDSDHIDSKQITHWKDLWKPEFKGNVLLTDDPRDVFGMALIMNGHSVNSRDEAEIKQAYETLKTLIPNVAVFNSDAPHIPYIAGEVSVGMQWNGTAVRAENENPALKFAYPQEGTIFWMDNMVIPAASEHKDAAYQFINFLLKPENQAKIITEIGYAAPNLEALNNLPDNIRQSEIIFPPKAIKQKGQFLADVGDATALYQRYWMELKK
ncbi:spermidine/putrescine ABC transporter substrate-binding protein [Photobacterium iliopiscarium]|jgi:spermidine/putrescine transport system substrate-binding protein|uniref:Putrescine-binding periplasmic protein n=1 Tax=Photobacterium iliopiscarium TaxID=56192 RepID=A0A0D8PZ11_9GAMM|nr:extracellular solute-binding protein [Photobacterium iliopiscarium]KJG12013.1 spermidine/putrescine ABC transporter substrate-binding protein [Photobacterium iliopiscarium]KJG23805.1 spermidine/putrescine ABC transporter substrate-binding protein [Photobacterium iliopiscarium]PST96401.1 spermidine/putrescine ABC transporter substrate-binding protein [Photobacterium iliopiscarium]PSU00104.1 spermidine/putrescine ABC transporter substrate-binding protein [Photobacterium iliopiscarium]PSV85306